jgi:serine/threonine protein kinase
VGEGAPPHGEFGRYRLLEVLHRGRSGEVFRALDLRDGRVVALKLFAPDTADREFRARFDRACRITAELREPRVVTVLDHGEHEGRFYVAMRLVDGPSLAAVLAHDGVLAPERAVTVVEQVARALAAAHARGLVHRNVKPSNMLFADPAAADACLVDFGLVSRNGLSLDYTAPERFRGGGSDHREDVYALGCVLYTCLTGSRPYPGRSLPERMRGHLEGAIPRPSEHTPGLPVGLDDVIGTALAKQAPDRHPTVGTLAAAARAAL